MGALETYISRQNIEDNSFDDPHSDLKMVVVIPCFNEPDITTVLLSLWENLPVPCSVEVIVVVNSSEMASDEQVNYNRNSFETLVQFASCNNRVEIKLLPILKEELPRKHAGVGLARKIGMDFACKRFASLNRPAGVIVALDADSPVSSNYFNAIFNFYKQKPKAIGANIAFEHVKHVDSENDDIHDATLRYELYLRYFRQGMKYAGFPYAYHTIGSCFSITADSYAKIGGMPRRQAGEDFYLLHKLFPLGYFGEIDEARVYPASRLSDRVPFGTGAMVIKIVNNANVLSCYHPRLFKNLKYFFSLWDDFFLNPNVDLENTELDKGLIRFLQHHDFQDDVRMVKNNSASLVTFKKQLFNRFGAFKTIQYLNEASDKDAAKCLVEDAAVEMLHLLESEPKDKSTIALLEQYRVMEQTPLAVIS